MLNVNEELNGLACSWYFLSELKKNDLAPQEAEAANVKQREAEQQLIPMLQQMEASKGNPCAVYIEGDTFVDLWLNEKGDIENSGHYAKPPYQ